MKVKELIERLQQMQDMDAEVVIHVDVGHGTVGPTPTVDVVSASGGIDWDNGKVFINTKERLYINLEKIRKEAGRLSEILGWYVSSKSGSCGMDTKGFIRIVKSHMERIIKEEKLEWVCEPLEKRKIK